MEETKNTPATEAPKPDLGKVLSEIPGAPEASQVEAWKKTHGEVFISGFSETEAYIWRPLRRFE